MKGLEMPMMFNRVMKNFFSKPITRLYPTKQRETYERTRGRIFIDPTSCIYCGICQRKCPADAIIVYRSNSTWELNAFRCIVCGECVNSCPKKCIKLVNKRRSSSTNKKTITLRKQPE